MPFALEHVMPRQNKRHGGGRAQRAAALPLPSADSIPASRGKHIADGVAFRTTDVHAHDRACFAARACCLLAY